MAVLTIVARFTLLLKAQLESGWDSLLVEAVAAPEIADWTLPDLAEPQDIGWLALLPVAVVQAPAEGANDDDDDGDVMAALDLAGSSPPVMDRKGPTTEPPPSEESDAISPSSGGASSGLGVAEMI